MRALERYIRNYEDNREKAVISEKIVKRRTHHSMTHKGVDMSLAKR